MKGNRVTSKTVFVSYSGNKTIKFASFIYDWIPKHLPGATTWATFNPSDLQQGKPDYEGITKAAKNAGACVCIVAQETADRPWLLFEAGLFAAQKKNVFTLLCDMDIEELRGPGHPLGFQNVTISKFVSVRGLLMNLSENLGLGLCKHDIRNRAALAVEEYQTKYLQLYPDLSEAERDGRDFAEQLCD